MTISKIKDEKYRNITRFKDFAIKETKEMQMKMNQLMEKIMQILQRSQCVTLYGMIV